MKKALIILALFCSFGVMYGQSAYSSPRQYPEYVQPYDFGLIERGLSMKQSLYNQNYNLVLSKQEKVVSLIELIYKLSKGNKITLSENQVKYYNSTISTIRKYQSWDFSNNQNTRNVLYWLDKTYNELYSWL